MAKSKYKAKWKENSMNKSFWKEVLVGRKIKSIRFDKKGISALILDSKEVVFLVGAAGRVCIKDKDSFVKPKVEPKVKVTPGYCAFCSNYTMKPPKGVKIIRYSHNSQENDKYAWACKKHLSMEE